MTSEPHVTSADAGATKTVLLASPRGYCAGVDRAVITVEKALDLYGAPVYVRKEIVHNAHVVSSLRDRGAIFVEETDEVPEGAIVVFSAHGVSPVVHEEAQARNLRAIDATSSPTSNLGQWDVADCAMPLFAHRQGLCGVDGVDFCLPTAHINATSAIATQRPEL